MRRILLSTALIAAATVASASSDEAWAEFRADVRDTCLAQQAQSGSKGETAIEVNSFGSERFGAAILDTTLPDGSHERAVCIYDKQARTAELTAPFDEPEAGSARSGADAAKAP